MSERGDDCLSDLTVSFDPFILQDHEPKETIQGDQYEPQVLPPLGPPGATLFDTTEPSSTDAISDESYPQLNLLQLLESWKEIIRDQWFRRHGICASLIESKYDDLMPELRAADNAQRHFREVLARGPASQTTLNLIRADSWTSVSPPSAYPPPYVDLGQGGDFESGSVKVFSRTVAQGSPASSESEQSCIPTTPPIHLGEMERRPAISIFGKIEPAAEVLAVTTSEDGDPQALTLLRNKSPASDWGDTYRGIIRVQRPAGVKWNEPIRCTYLSPITGDQCRTRVKRGPDLERHLRTVHVRQEAQAVSDGLIPRGSAKLLPSEWHVGDRLDFDCPYCSIRFTRDDARNRHVKLKH